MTLRGQVLIVLCLGALLGVWLFSNSMRTSVSENQALAASSILLTTDASKNTSAHALIPKSMRDTEGLPEQLERDTLEAAKRDPFSVVAPPPVTSAPQKLPPAPPPIVPVPAPAMAAPVPMAPPLNLRFMGRMTSPDGQHMIFASLAESPVTLSVGQELPNGYRVDSITDRIVQLSYPALGTTARLDLPEPPRYEIR
jgi:hypothetical protein